MLGVFVADRCVAAESRRLVERYNVPLPGRASEAPPGDNGRASVIVVVEDVVLTDDGRNGCFLR